MPRAGGPGARRSETPAARGCGAGADCLGVPGQLAGDEGASGPSGGSPRWEPAPLHLSPGPRAGDRGAPFSFFLRERGRRGYAGPFLCFGKISAAPECYLNSFCFSVPSGVGRNWKLAEMPGAIRAGAAGTVGKGRRRVPREARTGEGPSAAPAYAAPRAPGPAGTRRAERSWTRGARSLQEKPGTGRSGPPPAGPGTVAGQPSAPAGQWAPCPRPSGPAGELLYGLKVGASTSQTPACTWPPALAPARACACPQSHARRCRARYSAVAPNFFSGCSGFRLLGNSSGSFGREINDGTAFEVDLVSRVPQGPASRLRTPQFNSSGSPCATIRGDTGAWILALLAPTAVESHSQNGKLQRQHGEF